MNELVPEVISDDLLEMVNIVDRASNFTVTVSALQITNAETVATADNYIKAIRDMRKEIARVFDPLIASAYNHHKELVASKKDAEAPLREAEAIISNRLCDYMTAQRKLQQEALRKQQEDREKAMQALQEEREKAMKDIEEGKRLTPYLPTSIACQQQPTTTEVPQMEHSVIRETWDFRITNKDLLPRDYLMPNEVAIRAVVRALKGNTQIPGIEVFRATRIAGKGNRR